MTIATYPDLPGLAWPVARSPVFTNIVRSVASMRETRAQMMAVPRYEFDLSYEFLRPADLTSILGLFLNARGSYDRFLFTDRNDKTATAVTIGTGNGVATDFIFGRNVGPSFYEAVGYVAAVSALTVGGGAPGAHTLIAPNVLHFTTPPSMGQAVVASFNFQFVCRFKDDSLEINEFVSQLYEAKKVTLRTTEY